MHYTPTIVRYTPSIVPGSVEPPELKVYLDQEFRRVAAAQPRDGAIAQLFQATDDVAANDTTETPIVNYTDSEVFGILDADPVLGTITLPPGPGVIRLTVWASLGQTTNTRNFTTQLKLEINGVWDQSILSSGYIPQNGTDVRLGLTMSGLRRVTGGEVLRLGLILDAANSATYAIDNSTFEITYAQTRG